MPGYVTDICTCNFYEHMYQSDTCTCIYIPWSNCIVWSNSSVMTGLFSYLIYVCIQRTIPSSVEIRLPLVVSPTTSCPSSPSFKARLSIVTEHKVYNDSHNELRSFDERDCKNSSNENLFSVLHRLFCQ